MTLKTGATADENSDLHHWIKLYFKVYYIYIYIYIYIYVKVNITWHREEQKLLIWPATEHLNIMKNAHWRIFRLFCKMETNVAYISASVNIVKISILIVSKQRHSSWNSALDVLKLSVTLWVRSASDDSHAQEGNWTNHSNWFTNQNDSLVYQLLWSSLWTELTQKNESFANGHRSLPREQ